MNNKTIKNLQKSVYFIEHGIFKEAEKLLNQILLSDSSNFDALYLKGIVYGIQSKHSDCKNYLLRAEIINPNHAFLQYNLAKAMTELGEEENALKHHKRAVSLMPNNPDAWLNLGKCLFNLKLQEESLESFDRAIEINPNLAEAYSNRGGVLYLLKRFEDALINYDKVIELKPEYFEAYLYRGNIQVESKNLEDALLNYNKAIELNPEYSEAYFNRGNLQLERKFFEDALLNYEKAIELKPEYAEVYSNLGNLLNETKRYEQALIMYNKAIELKPNFAEAFMNRGNVEIKIKQFEKASHSYDKAVELRPNYAEVYANRGNLLIELGRIDEALLHYEKAIELKPIYTDAYFNRGVALMKIRKVEEATVSFRKVLDIHPDFSFALSSYINSKMTIADWSNLGEDYIALKELIANHKTLVYPLPIYDLTDDVAIQKKASENYSNALFPIDTSLGPLPTRVNKDKIRIAYLSADFTEHPMGYNFVGFFECLDRIVFEVIAISFIKVSDSPLTKRLVGAFDLFKTVDEMSDKEVCIWMRNQNIDIAVDMMGPTLNNRQDIFAMRCAPIQINQFSWTSGAPYMDYIIADPVSMPKRYAYGYSEKLAYVPHTLFATDDKRKISERISSRREESLPEHGLVLCCFNNSHKITPDVFDVWIHILQKMPESVLWIRSAGSSMEKNLCEEAQKRGVDPQRLIFAGRVESMAEHLARYRLADLFLDTFPFCAQTTASDALWAGVPVVTCVGESSMSRICASMLHTLEMPELVAGSLQEYEQKVLELVQDPSALKEMREKLAHQKQISPLFNTALYTRNIENAYLEINKLTIN